MAKKNWFIEANKSEDPAVKALLEQYNTLDANNPDATTKRDELKQEIRIKLGLAEEPTPVPETSDVKSDNIPETTAEQENTTNSESESIGDADAEPVSETPSEPVLDTEHTPTPVPETSGFKYTESDATKAKDVETLQEIRIACRGEIVRLERTRLKHGTYQENRTLDMKIWNVRRIISASLNRESALRERAHRAEQLGRVSGLETKRARFIKLLRQGISITNITKHAEGVKKNELEKVLDAKTIEDCRKHNSKFPEMWEKWKAKFIDKADENKS